MRPPPSLSSRAAFTLLALLTLSPLPGLAAADEPAPAGSESRQTLAEALFQNARELLAQGKAELACPKFAESQRMDPATGTLLNLAACHESIGKLATAWSEFNEALAGAQRDGREDRVRFARDHIRDLEDKLPRLTIRIRPEHLTAEFEIRLDEVPVGRAAWGTALPVDPGRHMLRAHAPGASRWEKEITIAPQAQTTVVEVPDLRPSPVDNRAGATDFPAASSRKRRTVMLASGALGAAGIVAGSAFGLYAFERWHDAEHACPAAQACNQTAVDARAAANRFAIASDAAFAVGIAGLGVAAYLWMTAPPARASAAVGTHAEAVPMVGPGTMGMAVEGRF